MGRYKPYLYMKDTLGTKNNTKQKQQQKINKHYMGSACGSDPLLSFWELFACKD